jgi:hypothetical protein
MPPKATRKNTDYCDPVNNVLCPEIIELRVIVKNIGESMIDMQHLILGNGKDGMKVEQSKQSEAIKQMDSKLDLVLAEQKIIANERITRTEQEKQQKKEKEKEEKRLEEARTNKQWTFRWFLGLAFDKFTAPIIVAIVLYIMLGGK